MGYIKIFNFIVFIIGLIIGVIVNILIDKYYIKHKEILNSNNLEENDKLRNKYITIKNKTFRKNYILVQVLTGILTIIIFNSLNPFGIENNIPEVFTSKIVIFISLIIYSLFTFFSGLIDVLERKVSKTLMLFASISSAFILIMDVILNNNLYSLGVIKIYTNILYQVVLVLLIIIQTLKMKKSKTINYIIDLLIFLLISVLFVGSKIVVLAIPIVISLYVVITAIKTFIYGQIEIKNEIRKFENNNSKSKVNKTIKNRGVIPIVPIFSIVIMSLTIIELFTRYYI